MNDFEPPYISTLTMLQPPYIKNTSGSYSVLKSCMPEAQETLMLLDLSRCPM